MGRGLIAQDRRSKRGGARCWALIHLQMWFNAQGRFPASDLGPLTEAPRRPGAAISTAAQPSTVPEAATAPSSAWRRGGPGVVTVPCGKERQRGAQRAIAREPTLNQA